MCPDPLNDGAFLSLLDPADLLGDPCCDDDDFDVPVDDNLFFGRLVSLLWARCVRVWRVCRPQVTLFSLRFTPPR